MSGVYLDLSIGGEFQNSFAASYAVSISIIDKVIRGVVAQISLTRRRNLTMLGQACRRSCVDRDRKAITTCRSKPIDLHTSRGIIILQRFAFTDPARSLIKLIRVLKINITKIEFMIHFAYFNFFNLKVSVKISNNCNQY